MHLIICLLFTPTRYLNAKGNHNGSLELPAYGLMVLGFGFFSIGTFTYMRRVAVLRAAMQLTNLEVGVMWSHSLIGLLAWVASASFLVTDGFSNRKLQWMQRLVQVVNERLLGILERRLCLLSIVQRAMQFVVEVGGLCSQLPG